MNLQEGIAIREDGGYIGNCTGCRAWYWNYWGAGTYCPSCLHGYCETLKGHWDDAENRAEELGQEVTLLGAVIAAIVERPMPDGNASCATEIERIKAALVKALD